MFKKIIFGITFALLSVVGLQEVIPQTTTIKMWKLRSLSRPVSNIDYFLVQDMSDTTRSFKIRADSLKTYLGLSDSFYFTMNLDSLTDGTIYGRVKNTSLSAGNLYISSYTVWDDSLRPIQGVAVTRADTAPDSIYLFDNGQPGGAKRAIKAGDIWIDTNDGDAPWTYNGGAWVRSYTSINGGSIKTGTFDGINYLIHKSAYTDTTDGFWVGDSLGTKMNLGNGDSYLKWQSGQLILKGTLYQSASGDTFPAPVYRGGWSGAETYYRGDWVTWLGASYIDIHTSGTNINKSPPDSTTYWSVYASKGATGNTGLTGATGSNGADGAIGAGIVYRGVYDPTLVYYNINSVRRDVVKYGSTYYIYNYVSPSTPEAWNVAHWTTFGATFSSIATGLLLAEDATILRNLTIGSTDSTYGAIRSANKDAYSDTSSGFFLGFSDNRPKLDIGNGTNYMRWNGIDSLIVRGHLNADDINAGTLTGRTVQTSSSGNRRLVLDATANNNALWLYNAAGNVVGSFTDSIPSIWNGTSFRIVSPKQNSILLSRGVDILHPNTAAAVGIGNIFVTVNSDRADTSLISSVYHGVSNTAALFLGARNDGVHGDSTKFLVQSNGNIITNNIIMKDNNTSQRNLQAINYSAFVPLEFDARSIIFSTGPTISTTNYAYMDSIGNWTMTGNFNFTGGQTGYMKSTAGVVSYTTIPAVSNSDSLGGLPATDYLKSASSDTSYNGSLNFYRNDGANPPFYVRNTNATVVTNLDADKWDGKHMPTDAAGMLTNNGTGTLSWTGLSSSYVTTNTAQNITGIKTFNPSSGSVPFVLNSGMTSKVDYLNVDRLDGYHASTTASSGVIPVLNSSGYFAGSITGNANYATTSGYSSTSGNAGTVTNGVYTSRTINSKPLSSNITLTASDVGAQPAFTGINGTYTVMKNIFKNPSSGKLQYTYYTITYTNGIATSVSGEATSGEIYP